MIYFQALAIGTLIGVIFALCKLPIPAPPTIAGVIGIMGITLGYLVIKSIYG